MRAKGGGRIGGVVTAALLVAGLWAPYAAARAESIDVRNDHALTITGVVEEVASLGDVNGDGVPDLASGGLIDPPGRTLACVIFGGATGDVDCRAPADNGFVIGRSAVTGGEYTYFIAPGGDVNGDGYRDVLVAQPSAAGASAGHPGEWDRIYVVFGKSSSDFVDLNQFDEGVQGDAGFTIEGPPGQSLRLADGLGDVNGDQFGDLVVGSNGDALAYVVFGREGASNVDLQDIDDGKGGGYRIDPPRVPRRTYLQLSAIHDAGDVDGDGRGDVVLGVEHFSRDPEYAGSQRGVWVAFGKAGRAPLDLDDIAGNGFHIADVGAWDFEGVGDLDRDGKDDLLVIGGGGDNAAGAVVWGKSDARPVTRDSLSRFGFRVKVRRSEFGWSVEGVTGVHDMNGDGVPELGFVIEQYDGDSTGVTSVWIAYGHASDRAIVVGSRDFEGLRLYGRLTYRQGTEYYSAYGAAAVDGVADIDGDGRGEVILRSLREDSAYLVLGR